MKQDMSKTWPFDTFKSNVKDFKGHALITERS